LRIVVLFASQRPSGLNETHKSHLTGAARAAL
jgi:hypothetical protein